MPDLKVFGHVPNTLNCTGNRHKQNANSIIAKPMLKTQIAIWKDHYTFTNSPSS